MPIALAPIGIAGLNPRRGEVQAARAAEQAGVPFCLSTRSACSLAEVVRGVTRPLWFQLYMIRDRAFMRDLLAQAAAHCSALVLTVDMAVPGCDTATYAQDLPMRRGSWARCAGSGRHCGVQVGPGTLASGADLTPWVTWTRSWVGNRHWPTSLPGRARILIRA